MTTIEILQAAIDEGCEVEIDRWNSGIYVCFMGPETDGWTTPMPTLKTAVASAWQHYQTNKSQ